MSMFNRNIKLHFNKMKYTDIIKKSEIAEKHGGSNVVELVRGRGIYFVTGLATGYSILNYDIFKYKVTRGLARWKGRVVKLFKSKDSHHH